MSSSYEKILLEILKSEVVPAAGCTEPVAVAYSCAAARKEIEGQVKSLDIWVDPGLYKNGLRVGIPGIKTRGLYMAAALGILSGDPQKGLCVLEGLKEEDELKALELVAKGVIRINIKHNVTRLYIETVLNTDQGQVRVLTLDRHLNVVSIEKGRDLAKISLDVLPISKNEKIIQKFTLNELARFADEVPLDELGFLEEGVEMNKRAAKEGYKLAGSMCSTIHGLIEKGIMGDDVINNVQKLCAAASEARMSGCMLPVMSTAGSGNHGITVFLTNAAVADKIGSPRERLLRALALSNLITIYVKSFTGPLSAMCGCGVAAGTGASAGIVYQMGGNTEQMFGAMLNMIGSIAGLICDGGKEGCAYKLALSGGWAVESALFSMQGAVIHHNNGILASDFYQLFKNLGHVCGPGMSHTNKAILDVMAGEN